MRAPPNGQQRTVVTVVNGEIHHETQISFSSVSVVNGEVRVHTTEGNQIDIQVPGADFALRFDLDGVQQIPVAQQTPVETVPVDDSLKLFTWKTVLITLGLWFFVGSVFGWLGFVVAAGYFGYHWRQVAERKKLLAQPRVDQAVPRSNSGMSRQSVRDALARKH
ncbi:MULTISPECIES: hypothetical protein [unclassified Pseudomonas]|uniref:hypothetical protein n=1 Tax=unclassified Pseudomonas TaxID=196821 RepID=UPI002A370B51|nr:MULTISPECIES: hypothetical protein [unclassified Pseudomonas]MDX9669528.1 hypothetical protein [Pseudomonas sp. P8_250]WPN36435.1 hypothetical protein QMK53_01905 [Pseudomonas sp. P8_139]WPN41764.1 hypothetical protein QMK55_00965 [Pseudomonas sp. P8_229]